jgi:hypothetical protein
MSRLDALAADLSEWTGQEVAVEVVYEDGEPIVAFAGTLGEPVENRTSEELRRLTWLVGDARLSVDTYALDGATADPNGVEATIHEQFVVRVVPVL